MADRAIHENGMSSILCDLCNMDPKFRNDFCSIFKHFPKKNENSDDIKAIDYMWFSGNYDTGFGRPDITIRFTDGSYFFIEVKTKNTTGVQANQAEEKIDKDGNSDGYIGLIKYIGQKDKVKESYAFLVDKGHPGFETDFKEIFKDGSKTPEFYIDVVTWNRVIECIEKYEENYKYDASKSLLKTKSRLSFFKDDIKNNVDGFNSTHNIVSFNDELDCIESISKYNKYKSFFNNLNNYNVEIKSNFSYKQINFEYSSEPIEIKFPFVGFYVTLNKELEKDLLDNSKIEKVEFKEKIWIGFNPRLLDDGVIVEPSNLTEKGKYDFLFSIGIYGDLLCKDKIQSSGLTYCHDDSYWYYFYVENYCLDLFLQSNKKVEQFKTTIKRILEDILKKCIPDNTGSINYTVGRDKKNE